MYASFHQVAYHVSLRKRGFFSLKREGFRPPAPPTGSGGGLWKPEGGLWLSLWRQGWGPEWGLWWVYSYDFPTPEVLEAPVYEVDLRNLRIAQASLLPPDFLDPEVDGWFVDPQRLDEEWLARPQGPRWWKGWDVRTVWLRVWPEERVRYLGTLGEVCPEEGVKAFLEALDSSGPEAPGPALG